MRWVERIALRAVPADWREAVARDLAEEHPDTSFSSAAQAFRIGVRLRLARALDRIAPPAAWSPTSRRLFLMRDFTGDLRFAIRNTLRRPGHALAVIGTLAVGIGATTAIFSVFNWIHFRPLPGVSRPAELVTITYQTAKRDGNYFVAYRDYADLRGSLKASVTDLAASAPRIMDLSTGSETRRIESEVVTHNYFSLFGTRFAAGRGFSPAEEHPGGQPSVVISERLWRDTFGADPSAVGGALTLNGRRFTIVGVAADGFQGRSRVSAVDAWLSMSAYATLQPAAAAPNILTSRRNAMFGDAFARLRPGSTVAQAQAEATAAMVNLPDFANRTPTPGIRSGLEPVLAPGIGLDNTARARLSTVFNLLMGGVCLLLVLACANAANLLLARVMGRRREIAVCQAIGASRARIIRQQLVEGMILSVAAGIAGLALAAWLTWLFDGMRLVNFLPAVEGVRIDWRVCAFALIAAFVTGVAFSTAPAIVGSRVDLQDSLKEGVTSPHGGRRLLRGGLVLAQVTVSVLLLVAAGAFVRTLHNIRGIDLGIQTDGLISFGIDPARFGMTSSRAKTYIQELLDRLRATPGIESASFSWTTSFSSSRGNMLLTHPGAPKPSYMATQTPVSPGFFATMRIPIVAGRDFNAADVRAESDARGIVILSRRLASEMFPNGSPVGAELDVPGWSPTKKVLKVVGVAADVRGRAVTSLPERWAYVPANDATWGAIQVRSSLPAQQTIAAIREVSRAVDPVVAPHDVETFGALVDRALSEQRLFARVSSLFAGIAALLAAMGIYGMMAGAVSERRKEFGIRLALGAPALSVLAMVMRTAVLLGAAGIVAGLGGAAALRRVVEARLYGVTALDPATVIAAALAVIVLTIAASLVPAVRAARVDPVKSLRIG